MGVLGASWVLEMTAEAGLALEDRRGYLRASDDASPETHEYVQRGNEALERCHSFEDRIYSAIHQDLGAAAKNLRVPGNLWKWRDLIHEQDKLISKIAVAEPNVEDPS